MAKHDYDTPIDVWLRWDADQIEEGDDDPLATYEANTFRTPDGKFRIEWYHNSVGQVSYVYRDTYEQACIWYEENGYQNFTA